MIFNDYSYIICPNSIKETVLKEITPFTHIKFITKKELLKNVFFDYDYASIYYLHKHYGYSFDNAEEILNNLSNIKNVSDKTYVLLNIYNDLKDNNLLKKNSLFKNSFDGYDVYVYGYSEHDVEIKSALNVLNIEYNYVQKYSPLPKHKVLHFKTIEDEVLHVFNKIGNLIDNGVSLNNIYIYTLPDNYELVIKKISSYYSFPVEGLTSTRLFDSPIFKKYLSLIDKYDYKEAYKQLESSIKVDMFDVLSILANIIINLSNIKFEDDDFKKMLIYISKKTNIKNIKYKEAIKICDENSILSSDDHVFVLGFSLDSYPKISTDLDLLSDKEKCALDKNTSTITNIINKQKLIDFLSMNNIYISYKDKMNKQEFYPSLLIKELGFIVEDGIIDNVRHSVDYAMFETASYKDLMCKYNIVSKYIDEFKDTLNYKSYSHLFTNVKDYDGTSNIKISYTQIEEYYECAFKYFVKRILKANIFEESFSLRLGSFFHLVLEDSLTKEVHTDDYISIIEEKFIDDKEKFFVELLMPQIINVSQKNKELLSNSSYNDVHGEQEFSYAIDDNTTFVGKADKIMIDNEDKKVIVVDYKTGKDKFDKKKNKFGLGLQLPLYATLLNHTYPTLDVSGLFIQNILIDTTNDIETDIDKSYWLHGLLYNDAKTIRRMDHTIGTVVDNKTGKLTTNSKFIKVKINDKGVVSGGSSKKEFDELVINAREKLVSAVDNIRKGIFDINPKCIDNDSYSSPCKFCECFDICFKDSKDVVHLSTKEDK